jgi:hypothetical protein
MNKEEKKRDIRAERIRFLQRIAVASQREVDRCFAEIDAVQTEEELLIISFQSPLASEGL